MPASPDDGIMDAVRAKVSRACNVASIVDPDGLGIRTAQGAQILHLPIPPAEGVEALISRQVGISDDVLTIICA
jgi:hypothetical protein